MNTKETKIKKFAGILAMLAAAACATTASSPDMVQADIAWIARGDFCEPETVLPLPDNTLLVSNVCGFATMGDGYLSLLDARGNAISWQVVDKLDAPLGMTLREEIIYIIDANQIKSFSWPEFLPIGVIQLDTKVANDITVSPTGDLYVSDTGAGQVIKITPNGQHTVLTSDTKFSSANGIEFGPNEKLFVGGEKLWRVDLTTGKAHVTGPSWLTDIDGIEFERNGTIQITPVGGPLVRLQQDGSVEILGGEGISSANHGFAESLNLALIPTGYDNTVIAIRVPPCREAC